MTWEGKFIRIPVEYRVMPHEKYNERKNKEITTVEEIEEIEEGK